MHIDEALVKKLKRGEIGAFDQLFDIYSSRLFAFGLKYLKSVEDAEELVQDVFFKIWRNREKLKTDKNFKSYLFTIAYNQIKKHFQHKLIFQELEEYYPNMRETNLETKVSYKLVIDNISFLLSQLPEKKQRIFHLSRVENKSAKEISQILGVSAKTVDNQISEVIQFLKEKINTSELYMSLFFSLFIDLL